MHDVAEYLPGWSNICDIFGKRLIKAVGIFCMSIPKKMQVVVRTASLSVLLRQIRPQLLAMTSVTAVMGSLLLALDPIYFTLVSGVIWSYLAAEYPSRSHNWDCGWLLWLVALTISALVSVLVAADVKKAILLNMTFLSLFFLAITISIGFRDGYILWFYRLVGIFTTILGIMALAVVYQSAPSPAESSLLSNIWMHRLNNSYLVVPNDLIYGGILAVVLVVMMLIEKHRFWQVLGGIGYIIWIGVALQYRSRSVLLALLLPLCFFYKTKMIWWLVLTIAAAITLGVMWDMQLGHKLYKMSLAGRLQIWYGAWQMFVDAPWFGHGAGSFRVLGSGYVMKSQVLLPSWLLDVILPPSPWPHNIYLEILAERGLLGFLIFLGFWAKVVSVILGVYSQTTKVDILEHRQLHVIGSIATSVALIGIFDGSINRLWFLVILAMLAGCVGALGSSHTSSYTMMEDHYDENASS